MSSHLAPLHVASDYRRHALLSIIEDGRRNQRILQTGPASGSGLLVRGEIVAEKTDVSNHQVENLLLLVMDPKHRGGRQGDGRPGIIVGDSEAVNHPSQSYDLYDRGQVGGIKMHGRVRAHINQPDSTGKHTIIGTGRVILVTKHDIFRPDAKADRRAYRDMASEPKALPQAGTINLDAFSCRSYHGGGKQVFDSKKAGHGKIGGMTVECCFMVTLFLTAIDQDGDVLGQKIGFGQVVGNEERRKTTFTLQFLDQPP